MGTKIDEYIIKAKRNTAFNQTITPPDTYLLDHIHVLLADGTEQDIEVPTGSQSSYLISLPLPPQKIEYCVFQPEVLLCMPTQMIQFESWFGGGGAVCYRNNINTCSPRDALNTVSARRVKAGSSMKWTGSSNGTTWYGTLGYFIQEITDVESNSGALSPNRNFPAIGLYMHGPSLFVPYYYELNPTFSGAINLWAADTLNSADYEWLVLPTGQLEFKRNGVSIYTSVIALDIVNKEYIFGTTQDNSPAGCRSNFRFEDMGATASWTVI